MRRVLAMVHIAYKELDKQKSNKRIGEFFFNAFVRGEGVEEHLVCDWIQDSMWKTIGPMQAATLKMKRMKTNRRSPKLQLQTFWPTLLFIPSTFVFILISN